jgi:4-amino-4-deoxy-L-arabinose transferase-like glycosyltransferase
LDKSNCSKGGGQESQERLLDELVKIGGSPFGDIALEYAHFNRPDWDEPHRGPVGAGHHNQPGHQGPNSHTSKSKILTPAKNIYDRLSQTFGSKMFENLRQSLKDKLSSSIREFLIIVILLCIVLLLRWPSLEQPFDNDSGANAYHARLILRGEPLYSTHHSAHQLPAIYYTYALAFRLFGDSLWSIKFFLILWSILIVFLIYRMGKVLFNRSTGFLAALLYACVSAQIDLMGTTAQNELFANLPRLIAVFILVDITVNKKPSWKFFFVGLFSAVSFFYRASYLSPIFVSGIVFLHVFRKENQKIDAWKWIRIRALWLAAGFLAMSSAILIYFAIWGLLPRFLLVFSIGRSYINFRIDNGPGSIALLVFPLVGLFRSNMTLLVFSIAGVLVIMNTAIRKRELDDSILYIAAFLGTSFIEAGVTQTFFLHYYLLIVPPTALIAAWFLHKMFTNISKVSRKMKSLIAKPILVISALSVILISLNHNYDFYRHFIKYESRSETYEDFVVKSWPGFGYAAIRAQKIAEYIKTKTSSDDRIYYWSGDVQVYYLADRRCAIDVLWPINALWTGTYKRIFSPRTKYIIVGEDYDIPHPDWLYDELSKNYFLETTIDGQEIYRRN